MLAPSVAAVEQAYDAAKYRRVPEAPALTITVPSLADPSLAPDRRHTLSVTAHHVPFARSGRWDAVASEALGDLVTNLVSTVAPDLHERTMHRWVLTPADLEQRYGCTGGSLLHGELALDQFLFMRPVPACARYSTPLAEFWLCGVGAHPANSSGAGGMLAARELAAR